MTFDPLSPLVAASCRRPWAVLGIAAALTALALWFVSAHFAMSTDASALISPKVGWRMAEHRMDQAFPAAGDTILVVVDGATPERAEEAAAALTARIAADRAHFTGARRPDGGPFLAREGLLFQSPAEVSAATQRMIEAQPFLGPLAADPSLRGIATMLGTVLEGVARGEAPLSRIDAPLTALDDALGKQAAGKSAFFSWQALFGGGAPTRRLILVRPVLDYGSLTPGENASAAIRAAAVTLGLDASHGATVRLTGSVPLSDEEFASLEGKAWLVASAMALAMLLTLWLATRSARIVAAILLTMAGGLVVTMALGIAAVGPLNLISIAFIPLFVGLGVDFGIQLSVRFQAERRSDADVAGAFARAARALGSSLLLAAGAVCFGFLAFLPTAYTGVAELGEIAGIGILVALAASATLLPALLVLIGAGPVRVERPVAWLARADGLLLRHRRQVLGWFIAATVASIATLPLVRFDFNPLHLRNVNGEAMATLADLMRDPDRNPNTIDLLAPNVPAARALAERLGKLPEVGQAMTIASFVPEDQPPKLAAIADAATLLGLTLDPIAPAPPASDTETIAALRAAAQSLARAGDEGGAAGEHARSLAKRLRALADGPPAARAVAEAMLVPPLRTTLAQLRDALAAQPVGLAQLPADLRAEWIARDGRARVQLSPKAGADNAALARFAAAVLRVAPDASGVAISTQGAARTISGAFVQAGALAFVLVSLLLLAALRSVREAAFTLAPVVLSIFLTLGTCVLIRQPINFANIIAFPLLFGVGVAFHIYFVMAWRGGAEDLLQSSLARAVFFSALATGTAFGSLWLSDHPGTASMGKILMLSLAWTLVCALVFEPALLGPQKREEKVG